MRAIKFSQIKYVSIFYIKLISLTFKSFLYHFLCFRVTINHSYICLKFIPQVVSNYNCTTFVIGDVKHLLKLITSFSNKEKMNSFNKLVGHKSIPIALPFHVQAPNYFFFNHFTLFPQTIFDYLIYSFIYYKLQIYI